MNIGSDIAIQIQICYSYRSIRSIDSKSGIQLKDKAHLLNFIRRNFNLNWYQQALLATRWKWTKIVHRKKIKMRANSRNQKNLCWNAANAANVANGNPLTVQQNGIYFLWRSYCCKKGWNITYNFSQNKHKIWFVYFGIAPVFICFFVDKLEKVFQHIEHFCSELHLKFFCCRYVDQIIFFLDL